MPLRSPHHPMPITPSPRRRGSRTRDLVARQDHRSFVRVGTNRDRVSTVRQHVEVNVECGGAGHRFSDHRSALAGKIEQDFPVPHTTTSTGSLLGSEESRNQTRKSSYPVVAPASVFSAKKPELIQTSPRISLTERSRVAT